MDIHRKPGLRWLTLFTWPTCRGCTRKRIKVSRAFIKRSPNMQVSQLLILRIFLNQRPKARRYRSADLLTASLPSRSKCPVNSVEVKRLDGLDDPLDGRGRKRNVVGIA